MKCPGALPGSLSCNIVVRETQIGSEWTWGGYCQRQPDARRRAGGCECRCHWLLFQRGGLRADPRAGEQQRLRRRADLEPLQPHQRPARLIGTIDARRGVLTPVSTVSSCAGWYCSVLERGRLTTSRRSNARRSAAEAWIDNAADRFLTRRNRITRPLQRPISLRRLRMTPFNRPRQISRWDTAILRFVILLLPVQSIWCAVRNIAFSNAAKNS